MTATMADKVAITVEVDHPPTCPAGYVLEAFEVSSPIHRGLWFGHNDQAGAVRRLAAVGTLHGELVAYCTWQGDPNDQYHPVQYRCWWQHRDVVWGNWVA